MYKLFISNCSVSHYKVTVRITVAGYSTVEDFHAYGTCLDKHDITKQIESGLGDVIRLPKESLEAVIESVENIPAEDAEKLPAIKIMYKTVRQLSRQYLKTALKTGRKTRLERYRNSGSSPVWLFALCDLIEDPADIIQEGIKTLNTGRHKEM